ncbi:MAG TPA: type II secretion system protein [Acidobacteriaceae bacterium]
MVWRAARQERGQPWGSEQGYVLLGVICMIALVLLTLAIAAPKVAASIQRDRELETVHRGEQYKRAIRLYYKRFGSYPSSLDQLEKTNNIRFLRKRYLDPLTGKDDWKIILMGQQHVCPLGFFGQPLGLAGAMSGQGMTSASSLANGSSASGFGASSGAGSGSGAGSFSGSMTGSTTLGGGATGVPCGAGGGAAAAGAIGGGLSASSFGSGSGSGSSTSGSGGGSGSSTGGSTGGFNSSTTLGGGPIVGVMPPLTKDAILQYKLKTKYNEWEFVYDPAEDQMAGAAGAAGGGGMNLNGTAGSPGSGVGAGGGTMGTGNQGFGGIGNGAGNGGANGPGVGVGNGPGSGPGGSVPPQ